MMDTLKIARDLSEGEVFSHDQAERLANAMATYWDEIRTDLVTKEYFRDHLDARLTELEARFDAKLETKLAQMQTRILTTQVALFILLGVAILFK